MKNLIFIFLFFGIAVLCIDCSDNNPSAPALNQSDQVTSTLDKKPAANFTGDMILYWSPGWVGTVTFDGVGTYGIRFFHLSDKQQGQALHVGERWEIYDLQDETTILMAGPDVGVCPMPKFPDPTKYVINGDISEAYGEFAEWLGRNIHIMGVINWDPVTFEPVTSPGTFRIN